MSLRLSSVVVTCLLLGGCASATYQPKQHPAVGLGDFAATAGLIEDEQGVCRVVMTFRNDESVRVPVNAHICADAKTWILTSAARKDPAK